MRRLVARALAALETQAELTATVALNQIRGCRKDAGIRDATWAPRKQLGCGEVRAAVVWSQVLSSDPRPILWPSSHSLLPPVNWLNWRDYRAPGRQLLGYWWEDQHGSGDVLPLFGVKVSAFDFLEHNIFLQVSIQHEILRDCEITRVTGVQLLTFNALSSA